MTASVRAAVAAHVIERERLIESIDRARPVALLLAPAGCGKSTVLGHYLARCSEPYVRFDVRREHAELLGFVRGFAETLQVLAPGARTSVADAVNSARSTPSPGTFLAVWMSSHLPAFLGTIVVDDVHLAMEDADCCDFLSSLVQMTGSRLRWIIAGRGAGRLPLAAWQGDGIAAFGPGEEELRFTRSEVAAAFAEADVPASEIDTLLSRTSGWAVALSLALRLRQRSPDLTAALASALELSHDYLAEQIYASLTGEQRSLLAVAAFLPDIDASVLEAAGFRDVSARLDELHRRHSILTPRDPAAGGAAAVYSCHDLFREYIVAQVNRLGTAERNAVKLRAARALDLCGQSAPALRLSTEAGETEMTLALIERDGFRLVDRGHADVLTAAIGSLSPQQTGHPAVLGVQGYLYHQQDRNDHAIPCFNRAIAATRDDVYRAELIVRCSLATWAQLGDPSPMLEPIVDDESLPAPLRAEVTTILAGSYSLFQPERDITALFARARALAQEVTAPARQSHVFTTLGKIAGARGLASAARELLLRGAEIAETAGLPAEMADAYDGLAEQHTREGDDVPAAQFAARGREAAEKAGRLLELRRVLHRQLAIFCSAGRENELDRVLARCKDVVQLDAPIFRLTMMSIEAISAGCEGDFAKAYALQSAMAESIPPPFWESRTLSLSRCAVFLAALQRREEALETARRALEECRAGRGTPRARYTRYSESASALCALACAMVADRQTARRLLAGTKRASSVAGRALLTAVLAIVETNDPNSETVRAAFSRLDDVMLGAYGRLFERILAKVRGDVESRHGLTQTELEILRALAAGDAPKLVAVERGCSVYTVRRHIRGIVEKLECRGYRQAVKVARERGIA